MSTEKKCVTNNNVNGFFLVTFLISSKKKCYFYVHFLGLLMKIFNESKVSDDYVKNGHLRESQARVMMRLSKITLIFCTKKISLDNSTAK
jgi:hypothetical protein